MRRPAVAGGSVAAVWFIDNLNDFFDHLLDCNPFKIAEKPMFVLYRDGNFYDFSAFFFQNCTKNLIFYTSC